MHKVFAAVLGVLTGFGGLALGDPVGAQERIVEAQVEAAVRSCMSTTAWLPELSTWQAGWPSAMRELEALGFVGQQYVSSRSWRAPDGVRVDVTYVVTSQSCTMNAKGPEVSANGSALVEEAMIVAAAAAPGAWRHARIEPRPPVEARIIGQNSDITVSAWVMSDSLTFTAKRDSEATWESRLAGHQVEEISLVTETGEGEGSGD